MEEHQNVAYEIAEMNAHRFVVITLNRCCIKDHAPDVRLKYGRLSNRRGQNDHALVLGNKAANRPRKNASAPKYFVFCNHRYQMFWIAEYSRRKAWNNSEGQTRTDLAEIRFHFFSN